MCDIKSSDLSRHHRHAHLNRACSHLPQSVTTLLPFAYAPRARSFRSIGMKPIMKSCASLFIASRLRNKITSSMKKGAALLIALSLLFTAVAAVNAVPGKKWQAPAAEAAKKNPVAASETSIAAGQKLYAKHCDSCH